MSIEANTYEEIKIINCNEKTASFAKEVGEYLLKTWGIIGLKLNVDGTEYTCEEDKIEDGTELFTICKSLSDAKEISFSLRSNNNGGAYWRIESCFMGALTDDEDLKNNVTYRSTDYYDEDSCVDAYLYDKNGLARPEYDKTAEDVEDISRWYCYTPDFTLTTEKTDNEELHEKILEIMQKLAECLIDCDVEDFVDDCFEDGEMYINGSFSFETKSIPEIKSLLGELADELSSYDSSEFSAEINAVPEGENDYNFAVVSIVVADGETETRYCRF